MSAGQYTVTLTVTDPSNATASDTAAVTVNAPATEITAFSDGFEVSTWNGLWTNDGQNDWFRSTQRAASGGFSAEVDGLASNAKLTSKAINLQGRSNATITFSWYIENSLDAGEYVAFDVQTNGATTWVEKARIRGNVDPEDAWQNVTVNLTGLTSPKMRFRAKMSGGEEDADVDAVKITVN